MKTSRFHDDSALTALCGAVLLLALGSGCSGDDESGSSCHDETPPPTANFPDSALKLASARVELRSDYTAGAGVEQSTLVNLSLVDLSTLVVQSRFPAPCCGSMACFSLTGSLAESCRGEEGGPCGAATCTANQVCVDGACVACARQPLNADKVTVSGLKGGSVDLDSPALGAFVATNVAPPLFGGEQVKVEVSGRDEAGFYPTYSQSIDPPDALEVLAPDPKAPGAAGANDLQLKWRAGNGDWMEVSLRSSDTSVTDKVVCLAVDDGCATIPVGAIETIKLDMVPEDRILITVQRLKAATQTVIDGVAAQLKVAARVDMALEQ